MVFTIKKGGMDIGIPVEARSKVKLAPEREISIKEKKALF